MQQQLGLFNQIETGKYVYNKFSRSGGWEQADPFPVSSLPHPQQQTLLKLGYCPIVYKKVTSVGIVPTLLGIICLVNLIS